MNQTPTLHDRLAARLEQVAIQNATPNPYQRQILIGLQRGKHVYAGTVTAATIAKRRAANKAARVARRANRG